MESDIVDRLRRYFVTQRNQWNAADEIKRLQNERDEARREVMLWMSERSSKSEMTTEYKKRGWEYLKENTNE